MLRYFYLCIQVDILQTSEVSETSEVLLEIDDIS